jgi:hypothetical protein
VPVLIPNKASNTNTQASRIVFILTSSWIAFPNSCPRAAAIHVETVMDLLDAPI